MWLHELNWRPREPERYFEIADVIGVDGKNWRVERYGHAVLIRDVADPEYYYFWTISNAMNYRGFSSVIAAQAFLLELTGVVKGEHDDEAEDNT